MSSDLISYGLLAGIFILTCLRMVVDKPSKLNEMQTSRGKRSVTKSNEKEA